MSIETVVKEFRSKQEEVVFSQEKLMELTRRSDDVRENLPRLERQVASVRAHREGVIDRFVLEECSEAEFVKSNEALEKSEKALENERLINDAILRQIKKIESELPKLQTEVQLAEREVWEEISAKFEAKVSDEVKEIIATVISVGCQIGRTRQFVLDILFQNPSSDKIQEIQKNLRDEYKID